MNKLNKNKIKNMNDKELIGIYKFFNSGHVTPSYKINKHILIRRELFKRKLIDNKNNKITAIIPALNEEKKIRGCLESLKWCDKIIVVDAGSLDKTPEIASDYADIIIRGEKLICSDAIRIGLDFITTDWVIELDADEKLSEDAKKEILKNIKDKKADGFIITRKNIVFGKVIGVKSALRIFNLKKAEIPLVRQHLQTNIKINGKIKKLKGNINHYIYYTIESEIDKFNRYTSNQVKDRIEKEEEFKLFDLFFEPVKVFIYRFFCCKSIKQGVLGLFRSVCFAFFRFVEEVKLFEKYQDEKNKKN